MGFVNWYQSIHNLKLFLVGMTVLATLPHLDRNWFLSLMSFYNPCEHNYVLRRNGTYNNIQKRKNNFSCIVKFVTFHIHS